MKYKLITLVILLWVTTQVSFAQVIAFKTNMSWADIKRQALKDNKYIFMDVGATWCGPCHLMEKDVFTKDSVGQFFNKNFISVKLQGDSTPKDNEQIKSWYPDVKKIMKDYTIQAYPTYLFFSPQGELVYRGVGTMSVQAFIKFATIALDPEQNITARKASFLSHKTDLSKEGDFAINLNDQRDNDANLLAADYKSFFLDAAPDSVLLMPENLQFILVFRSLIRAGDRYFDFFYNNGLKIDSLIHKKGQSELLINRIITMNEISKFLYDLKTGIVINHEPDWDKMEASITLKYSAEVSNKIILQAKYNYYCKEKNWQLASESGINWIETMHLGNTVKGTEVAYTTIFKHSENKAYLEIALKWTESYLKLHPDAYDAVDIYAWLLYKIGKTAQAIDEEQRAIALLTQADNEKNKSYYLSVFTANLDKMKAGKPTW